MSRKYAISGVIFAFLALGAAILSCTKDNSTTTSDFTSTQLIQAQDAETQDAIAQALESDVDANMSTLQDNGFTGSSKEAAGCVSVTVNHPDTTTWPKLVTLVFDCSDTINNEIFSKTGTVMVTVDTLPGADAKFWWLHFKWTIEFSDFMFGTDSANISINGTRTVYRKAASVRFVGNERIVNARDSVVSDITLALNYDGVSKSITRNVNRIHKVVAYRKRGVALSPPFIRFFNEFEKDTTVITGNLTGVDAEGADYSRDITTPLVVTFCPEWPHNYILSSGSITQTINNSNIVFTYSPDGCNTVVTIDNNGKTKVIERRLGRRFRRWW
jgi:hypothetical protein